MKKKKNNNPPLPHLLQDYLAWFVSPYPGGMGVSAPLLSEYNAQISPALRKYFPLLPKIILLKLRKSLKIIQLLPSAPQMYSGILPKMFWVMSGNLPT